MLFTSPKAIIRHVRGEYGLRSDVLEFVDQVQIDHVDHVGTVVPYQVSHEEAAGLVDVGRADVDVFIGKAQGQVLAPVVLDARGTAPGSIKRKRRRAVRRDMGELS